MKTLEAIAKTITATVFLLAIPGWLLLSATEHIDEDEYEFLYHFCGFIGFVLALMGAAFSIVGWAVLLTPAELGGAR